MHAEGKVNNFKNPNCMDIFVNKFQIYNLGQNCWDKIENLLFSEKKPSLSPQINVVGNVLGFWQQNLARFNIGIGG